MQNRDRNIPFKLEDYTQHENGWLFYNVQLESCNPDTYPKVHVSLEQTPDNLQKAKVVVEGILVKYQLVAMKIATAESIKNYKKHNKIADDVAIRNLSGKEITLALCTRVEADNNNPEFWKRLFIDVEQELRAAGVKPNPKYKSIGDTLIPGSNWISYRDQDNIFGVRVRPSQLVNHGFTRHESANLTGRFKKLFSIPDVKEAKDAKDIMQPAANPVRFSIKLIPDFIKDDDTGILRIYASQITKAKKIFFPSDKILNDKYAISFQAMFYPTDEIAQHLNQDIKKCLDACLMLAARYTAMIHMSLEKAGIAKRPVGVTNIIPALYHHFVKPLVQRAKARNGELLISDFDKQQLIREVVKCGLRADGSHIDVDQPRYVGSLPENVFDKLLDQICAHEAQIEASASAALVGVSRTAPAARAVNECTAIPGTMVVNVRTAMPAIQFYTSRYGFCGMPQTKVTNASKLTHPKQGADPTGPAKKA